MPPAVAKKKLDKAFKKPEQTLTLSEAKNNHADPFEVNACMYFGNLDVGALLQLYQGTESISGIELHKKQECVRDAIEARFNI
jgi:hypothetical protein